MQTDPSSQQSDALVQLVDDAVEQIIKTQDFNDLLAWMREPGRFNGLIPPDNAPGAEETLAFLLARTVWNATPLPRNKYRPLPLPKPARNEPCPCGSGYKYKRCCANTADGIDLDREEIWTIAISHFSEDQIKGALSVHAIPTQALTVLAEQKWRQGHNGKAKTLLEPMFSADLSRLADTHEGALELLCDVYTDLGYTRKKRTLLNHIIQSAPTRLRSVAYQRLATMLMDEDQAAEAWHAFQQAQRCEPSHPGLSALEVTLLISQGRLNEASERARFWRRKLADNEQATPELLSFLDEVTEDPAGALMSTDPTAQLTEMKTLIEVALKRPVPQYRVADEFIDDDLSEEELKKNLKHRLNAMGIQGEEAERALAGELDLDEGADPADEFSDPNLDLFEPDVPPDEPLGYMFAPPSHLTGVEYGWHTLCPLNKPFSVSLQPFSESDPWEQDMAEQWMDYLHTQPSAMDSLDILDDLASALDLHPFADFLGGEQSCYVPLLERAVAIIDQALASAPPEAVIPWFIGENRPALRLLYRYILTLEEQENTESLITRCRQYLSINPEDNHGLRGLYVDTLLRQGKAHEVLELCEQFPNDMLVETAYGRVLALYRLGELDAARHALTRAHRVNEHVPTMLYNKRVRKPALRQDGVLVGGKDQAWVYREQMRDVWCDTKGAIDWLKCGSPKRVRKK